MVDLTLCVLLVGHVILFNESQNARVSCEENALAARLELQQRVRTRSLPYFYVCMYVSMYLCMYV